MRIGAVDRNKLRSSTALGVATAMSTVALMACAGILIDEAALRPPLYTLLVLMAAVQLLALCRGPLRYCERLVSHDAALGVLSRLRVWLYDEIEPRSPAGLHLWRDGDLLARATTDVENLQDLYIRGISPLVIAAVTSAFAAILLTFILPVAGLILAGGLIGALLLTCALAWVRHEGSGAKAAILRGELAADVVELVQGASDLVAFGLDEEYLGRALTICDELARQSRRLSWTAGAISGVTTLVSGATVIGLLVVAVEAVTAHRLSGFMLAVMPLVALGAFEVVVPAADALSRLAEQLGSAERLLSVADLPVPVVDQSNPATVPDCSDIELSDVRLRYGVDHPWVLDGVSLSMPMGQRVALVGASGAGKSSVVNLLLRFWAPDGGKVILGGTPVDVLAQSDVRSSIGWVAQDTHLFNTTIRANVVLGKEQASDEEIAAVVRAAQLSPWIDSLPSGLDTPVGENGAHVSGGQRQRIALARAMLADPAVLVLDEATSGLDQQTAARLLRDVLATCAGKTVVHVTHRVEELGAFDEIYEIDGGTAKKTFGRQI
jgi:ATP-binding cassette subfamily C protein CydC